MLVVVTKPEHNAATIQGRGQSGDRLLPGRPDSSSGPMDVQPYLQATRQCLRVGGTRHEFEGAGDILLYLLSDQGITRVTEVGRCAKPCVDIKPCKGSFFHRISVSAVRCYLSSLPSSDSIWASPSNMNDGTSGTMRRSLLQNLLIYLYMETNTRHC